MVEKNLHNDCLSSLFWRGCISYQSGERLNGIQEVSGSIPLISTKKNPVTTTVTGFFFPLLPFVALPIPELYQNDEYAVYHGLTTGETVRHLLKLAPLKFWYIPEQLRKTQ